MLIGVTIFKNDGNTIYSPQFGRGGNAANSFVDVQQWVGGGVNPQLIIVIEHKNSDDTSWTTLATFAAISAVGAVTVAGSAIKEQLRFTYTFTGGQRQRPIQ